MKPSLTLFATLILLCASALADTAGAWSEDYPKALEQAKAEHKKVLLEFAGTDWCTWCKKMEAEVFETQKFKDYAAKHFVLLRADFPRKKRQSNELKAQNLKLQTDYQVEGYPTLILLDSDGKKLWEQSGYHPGGADTLLKAVRGR